MTRWQSTWLHQGQIAPNKFGGFLPAGLRWMLEGGWWKNGTIYLDLCKAFPWKLLPLALLQAVQEILSMGKPKPSSAQGAAARSNWEGPSPAWRLAIVGEGKWRGGRGSLLGTQRDRTRANGFNLQEGWFILDIRKKFFTMRVVKHCHRLSRGNNQ